MELLFKPPLFHYETFCKSISIYEIIQIISNTKQLITLPNTKEANRLVAKEVIKMFMNQVSSLKKLSCCSGTIYETYIPIIVGSRDCLANLSKLSCYSNIKPEFFYQLSQICHKIKTLKIVYEHCVSNGLKELISSQHNLNGLSLIQSNDSDHNYCTCSECYDSSDEEDDYYDLDFTKIGSSLIKHSSTIKKLLLINLVHYYHY